MAYNPGIQSIGGQLIGAGLANMGQSLAAGLAARDAARKEREKEAKELRKQADQAIELASLLHDSGHPLGVDPVDLRGMAPAKAVSLVQGRLSAVKMLAEAKAQDLAKARHEATLANLAANTAATKASTDVNTARLAHEKADVDAWGRFSAAYQADQRPNVALGAYADNQLSPGLPKDLTAATGVRANFGAHDLMGLMAGSGVRMNDPQAVNLVEAFARREPGPLDQFNAETSRMNALTNRSFADSRANPPLPRDGPNIKIVNGVAFVERNGQWYPLTRGKSTNPMDEKGGAVAGTRDNPARPQSAADYRQLPPGAYYLGSDGKMRQKK